MPNLPAFVADYLKTSRKWPATLASAITLIFFLCTSAGLTLSAQTLTLSEEIPIRADTEYHLVGKLGGRTMLLQDRGTKFFLNAYDRRMQESWEKELELRGRSVTILDIVATQRDFKLLYLYRERGHLYLQLDRYDPAANIQDSITLADIGYSLTTPRQEVVQSEDHSKSLIMLHNEPNRFTFFTIDLDSLEVMRRSVIQPEDFYYNQNFLQAEIANDGTAFFALERDNFVSRRKDHYYEIYQASPDTVSSVTYSQVHMGDSLTYDLFFRYDNLNERLVCGGLYTSRDLARAEGYFYLSMAPDQPENRTLHFEAFDPELVSSMDGNRRRNREGIEELAVRDLVLRRDGGMLLITERNRQFERRSTATQLQVVNNFVGRPLVDYHYDELLVLSVHPDGQPHWHNVLHKRQYSQDDGGAYSSFFLLRSPQRLHFLFNDDVRLENTVSEYVLDGYGESDRNSLFHTRDLELRLRFRSGVQVAANELVVPSERRNRLRLVTMTY